MRKIGLLFSGQGSQNINMGLDLYQNFNTVKELYDNYETIKNISFTSNIDELNKTINTQPALVLFHLAILRLIKQENIQFDACAGLSLGEFSTLVASEVLKENEVMEIILKRATFMSDACKKYPSTLIALMSKDENLIYEVINILKQKNFNIEIANLNAYGQVVIGVSLLEKNDILDFISTTKVKAIPLNVEGAFHTSKMNDVEPKLKETLSNYTFSNEKVPIIFNNTGSLRNDENFVDLLSKQVNHTTYFYKSLQTMINMGINTFIEIGYNDIFKKIIKKLDKNITVLTLNSTETLNLLKEELKNE